MKKTIKVKELNIEVEVEETQKGRSFREIKIPKGWRLLTGTEAMFLYENYQDKLKLNWFFVKPINNYPVVRFGVGGNGADLVCSWNPDISDSGLGVRFCRELK